MSDLPSSDSTRSSPPLRWYQFRLRSLFILGVFVAVVAGAWVSSEQIPYTEYSRGRDAVISTDRFEIIVKGVGDLGTERGKISVGGASCEMGSGTTTISGKPVWTRSHWFCFGVLRYKVNGTTITFRNHAREVTVGGRTYSIQHRAIITIDEQGGIGVEDCDTSQGDRSDRRRSKSEKVSDCSFQESTVVRTVASRRSATDAY
jgi:hypothetical protein